MNTNDTTCALLTRLAAQHGDWIIRWGCTHDDQWAGWIAVRGDETVCAGNLWALECELAGR